MEFSEAIQKAKEVRELYRPIEEKRGKVWGAREHTEGLVGDVGALMKMIMVKEGLRGEVGIDEKISHELMDILYSVFVIASDLNIDLENIYKEKIAELAERIEKEGR